MSAPDNPAAFPTPFCDEPGAYYQELGMSMRDWFAGQSVPILAVVASNLAGSGNDLSAKDLAEMAYDFANAMMAERARGGAS